MSKDNQSLTSNSFLLDDDMRYSAFPHPTSLQLLVVLKVISVLTATPRGKVEFIYLIYTFLLNKLLLTFLCNLKQS